MVATSAANSWNRPSGVRVVSIFTYERHESQVSIRYLEPSPSTLRYPSERWSRFSQQGQKRRGTFHSAAQKPQRNQRICSKPRNSPNSGQLPHVGQWPRSQTTPARREVNAWFHCTSIGNKVSRTTVAVES